MVWHRTDDGFPEHPKSDALAEYFGDDWAHLNLAFALWHHMGCDCAARRTDGVFNAARACRVMRAPKAAIDKALSGLVAVRFVETRGDGFVFHDWAEYQPTRAQLNAEREAKTARQSKWRKGKSDSTANSSNVDAHVDASTPPSVDASTPPSVDASRDGTVDAAPSRPVPTRPDPKSEEEAAVPAVTPPGVPPSGSTSASDAAKKAAPRKAKTAPRPDSLPLPGTPARAVYDALLSNPVLREITGNPGDFAAHITDPDVYPGVNVLAEVKRACGWSTDNPTKHRDGRAFLRNWLARKADEIARAPKPATGPVQRPAVSIVRAPDPVVTPEEHARRVADLRAAREAIAANTARKDASR